MRLVLDTSALLSLEAGKVLDLVIENFELVIPRRVQERKNAMQGIFAKNKRIIC